MRARGCCVGSLASPTFPGSQTAGALVVLVAIALAVAATAGAAHPRTEFIQSPYGGPTTVGGSVMPDLTGIDASIAVEVLQAMGVIPVVTGLTDSKSVVGSQEPPPGQYVPPGARVHLITNRPGGPAATFPAIPSTTTPSPTPTH